MVNKMFQLQSISTTNLDLSDGINLILNFMNEILLSKKDELILKSDKFKPLVIGYLTKNKEATTSQIAKSLGLTFEETFFILRQLEKKGRVVIS